MCPAGIVSRYVWWCVLSVVLRVRDLVKSYGDRRVLDGVSLSAGPGRRIGLVGDNGVGKSTLLRVAAGREEPDSGEVWRPQDLGLLDQEPPFASSATVHEVLERALVEIRFAQARLDELAMQLARCPEDPAVLAAYGEVLEWAQQHDVWGAEHRADLVLERLGLAGVDRGRQVGALSGGQRTRLGLAVLLLRQPRALLLDEPTNHLDDAAVEFVARHLAVLPGAVVLASHDREFLDAVCTDVVDLDPALGGPVRYGGAFSEYLVAKRERRARWEQQYAAEQDELAQLRRSVEVTARQVGHGAPRGNTSKLAYDYTGSRVQKQVSRRVRDARARLAELSAQQVRKPPVPLRFAGALTGVAASSEVVVQLRGSVVAGRLQVGSLDVAGDARLLVTGPNGAGKSTLLRVLSGDVRPDAGSVQRRRGLRVGLLEQDAVFGDEDMSARSVYAAATTQRPGVPRLVDLGLLAPSDVDRPVGVLSVGQRRRLALALLVADPPEMLLLDEPTNHLSLSLVDELEQALASAPGAVVVASHDRWLRRRFAGPVVSVSEGVVRR